MGSPCILPYTIPLFKPFFRRQFAYYRRRQAEAIYRCRLLSWNSFALASSFHYAPEYPGIVPIAPLLHAHHGREEGKRGI